MARHAPTPSFEQAELIDRLGGVTAVARLIADTFGGEATSQMVSNWKRRGIPYRYRLLLASVAKEREIDLPEGFLGEVVPMQRARQAPEIVVADEDDRPGFLSELA